MYGFYPELVHTKFNEGTFYLENHHQSFWQLIDPLAQHCNSQLACILAGQCLKFCDDTPSVAMLPMLNNPQDL